MRNYLQNGICYADVEAAKADFVSRINSIEDRAAAIAELSQMSTAQLQAMFGDCMHPADWFAMLFSALVGVAVICLSASWIKKASQI